MTQNEIIENAIYGVMLTSGQTVRCFRARELAEGGLSHA